MALIAYEVSPARGSEPGNSWRLAAGLAEHGLHVNLITTDHFADEWPGEASWPSRLERTIVDDRVPGLLARGRVGVYTRYLRFLEQAKRVVANEFREERIDLVHHFSWGSLFWGTPVAKLGVPYVFGPVGGGSVAQSELLALMPAREARFERLRNRALGCLRANPRATAAARHGTVLAANSDTAHAVRQLGGGDVSMMLPEATPAALLAAPVVPRASRVPNHLLWVGRLLPRKGVTLALDVLGRMPDVWRLTVVGDGPERARAEARTGELGLSSRVTFTGLVPWADVAKHADSATALLFTSVRDTTGAQVLEAAARGTPIVAIEHQGACDFLPGDAGAVVPAGSPRAVAAAMAEGVLRLACDDTTWSCASLAARRFAERHALRHQVEDVAAVYEVALRAGRHPRGD